MEIITSTCSGVFCLVLSARSSQDRGEAEHGDHVPVNPDSQVLRGSDWDLVSDIWSDLDI